MNSHLFPEEFKKTVQSLSKKDQKTLLFFEKKPLSSPGTLYTLKKELQKSSYFTYINGDSLLFPSSKNKLLEFEKEFLNSKAEALLFVVPAKLNNIFKQKRVLYCDSNQNLIDVAFPKNKKQAYFFTGLALFKSSLLDELKSTDKDLFSDFLQPLCQASLTSPTKKKIKIFRDEKAFFLEAGDKESYLKSTEFCIKSLYASSSQEASLNKVPAFLEKEFFQKKTSFVKEQLKETFQRFDPKDEKVGLENGLIQSKKLKALLLAPSKVKDLHLLKVKGFCIIDSQVHFYNKTEIENSVLACSHYSLSGSLKKEFLL